MQGDLKEVIGVLMRVLDGGEASPQEIEELSFDAEGELRGALNEAHSRLLEFAHDRDARRVDRKLDDHMRSALQRCLDEIVRTADAAGA